MRQLRTLAQGVWYEVRSRVNNRKPLFHRSKAVALFNRVFQETKLRFPFQVRGLRLENDWLSFYIKPEDGMALPKIMQRMKQAFAQRYNGLMGWIGHIWGDRYWSEILEGEPEEVVVAELREAAQRGSKAEKGVRPLKRKRSHGRHFPRLSPFPPAPAPG
jgi:REP element-mobilizing transposase RayT